jgi:two-component system, NtrC family, sensor histidine kinase KinB
MSDYTRASLELLYNISRELTTALDLHTVLTRVLALSTQSVQAERGSVIVMDEQQQPVDAAIVYEGRLTPHTVDQLKSTLEQGLAGWVLRNRQAAFVPDTQQDARWQRRPDDEKERSGAKSAICVPITMRDEMVGVLTMVHASPNFFRDDHLSLLQAIADQAGIAIHNARLYESLQAAHRRYQELFEDSIDPILVTNLEGKIQETNRRAIAVSEREREQLMGASVWDLHKGGPEWLLENIEAIQSGETVSCETEFYPLQHVPIPVEIYIHMISFGGETLLQWIFRDITERKQLDSLRDDLSAMIYHDLRSPLANIVSSLDMLRTLVPEISGDGQGNIVTQVVSIAIRSSERMQRLINSLLDINHLEAGQPITNRKPIDVLPLIREALDSVYPITVTKRQKINLETDGTLPKIWVDEDMIRRVLINLLENATKFTHLEGVLSVGAKADGDWVEIWVRDTGPGIPTEAQETIFNKFSRIQVERLQGDRLPKGLGLGLAFCRLAVQAHGGKIGVESEPGSGSCFFFSVPAAKE